jgi:hypothetical protein
MGSSRSTRGRKKPRRSPRPPGWGVEVRLPKKRAWMLLMKPGQEVPLSTHLAGARAWAEDWERRGAQARLVELEDPRGGAFRPRPPVQKGPQPRVVTHQMPLF